MFQNNARFNELMVHAGHRVKECYDCEGVLEDIMELELLVRNEYQVVELELLIETTGDCFGISVDDELDYLRG